LARRRNFFIRQLSNPLSSVSPPPNKQKNKSRFGLAGGLAWLGFLAVGTLGEQVKTRLEVAAEASGARDVAGAAPVTLPSGVTYVEERVGGGQAPAKGMLVVLNFVGRADGAVFEDTRTRGKPIVYVYGTRPFTGGLCAGVEEALATMRAGGRRSVTVPAERGFGARGAVLRPTEHVPDKQGVIPGGATLEYDLELVRVSVPPS
jgi:FKBP-type peptidyl-prolyl cis-trans isomerase